MVSVGRYPNRFGDAMSKYSGYYEQVKSANCFPMELKAINADQVAMALQKLIRREKLSFIVKKKFGRITVNKKADA